MEEFISFGKIPRYSRECIITEKIDGTNAQILITEYGDVFTGSRKCWITPEKDNFGFSAWVEGNKEDILKLGPGRHFGEWWGQGIQRSYNLKERRFSLFNTKRWKDDSVRPSCCYVVPVISEAIFDTFYVKDAIRFLIDQGSLAAPGFMKPEGIVIYHTAGNLMFKKTIEKDEKHKGEI